MLGLLQFYAGFVKNSKQMLLILFIFLLWFFIILCLCLQDFILLCEKCYVFCVFCYIFDQILIAILPYLLYLSLFFQLRSYFRSILFIFICFMYICLLLDYIRWNTKSSCGKFVLHLTLFITYHLHNLIMHHFTHAIQIHYSLFSSI